MILLVYSEYTDCTDVQADLGLHCPHMPENTFSHGAAYLFPNKNLVWVLINRAPVGHF